MRHAETVTFGGSAMDRAAHLRTNGEAIDKLAKDDAARSIVLWRGKPLMAQEGRGGLCWLALDHPMLAHASENRIFLGIGDAGGAMFASDVSSWEPEEGIGAEMGAFLDPSQQRHPDASEGEVFGELRANMLNLSPRDAEAAATAKAVLGWHETHGFCSRCGEKSTPAQAGWTRRCPSCSAMHFPRTDPVVIMLITHGNQVLLGRSHGWPDKMYSLLAGFVEPGETLEAAVRREVAEETGVSVGAVRYLASQPWPFPASLMVGCEGQATSRKLEVDQNEIEDAIWLSRDGLHLALQGLHPDVKPARKGSIAHFLLKNWLADQLD